MARPTSIPDQSSSMLLIAKAQYESLRSESAENGIVEKLHEEFRFKHSSKAEAAHLPSAFWQARKNFNKPGRSSRLKSSRRMASERRAVYVIMR